MHQQKKNFNTGDTITNVSSFLGNSAIVTVGSAKCIKISSMYGGLYEEVIDC